MTPSRRDEPDARPALIGGALATAGAATLALLAAGIVVHASPAAAEAEAPPPPSVEQSLSPPPIAETVPGPLAGGAPLPFAGGAPAPTPAPRRPSVAERLDALGARLCGTAAPRESLAPMPEPEPGAATYSPEAVDPLAPWMAKLDVIESVDLDGGATVANCGATALTRDWLITAAHCVGLERWLSIEATLGARDLGDGRALRREVSVAVCHAEFMGDGIAPDLALLRLDRPLPPEFPTIRVATSDEMTRLEIGARALAAGWRRRREGVSRRLTASWVRLTDREPTEPESVLVAAPEADEASLCLGESGAPLVSDLGLGPVVIGVFSSVDAFYNPASGRVEELCEGFEARSYFASLDGRQSWISDVIRACDSDVEACLTAQ